MMICGWNIVVWGHGCKKRTKYLFIYLIINQNLPTISKTMLSVYKILGRPYQENCCQMWSPYYNNLGLLNVVSYYTVPQKSSHLQTLWNFVKSKPIFKTFALLESVWNLLPNPHDFTHFTISMLLHYLGKLKIQNFCRYSADVEESANKLHFDAS